MPLTAQSLQPPTCDVPGCTARVHGMGVCRRHYDERRYLETTGQTPEAEAAAAREQRIETELTRGCPPGREPVLATEAERRQAWEERRGRILEEYATPPFTSGKRADAWWEFDAERPEYLSEADRDLHDLTRDHAPKP